MFGVRTQSLRICALHLLWAGYCPVWQLHDGCMGEWRATVGGDGWGRQLGETAGGDNWGRWLEETVVGDGWGRRLGETVGESSSTDEPGMTLTFHLLPAARAVSTFSLQPVLFLAVYMLCLNWAPVSAILLVRNHAGFSSASMLD